MQPTIRRATPDDLAVFCGPELARAVTTKAWVGLIDGQIAGIGGFHFEAGTIMAFLNIPEGPARTCKATIWKMAVATMRDAKAMGYRRVFADMDEDEPNAQRFLERLGFKRVKPDSTIFLWENAP